MRLFLSHSLYRCLPILTHLVAHLHPPSATDSHTASIVRLLTCVVALTEQMPTDVQSLALMFAAVWAAKVARRHIDLAQFPNFVAQMAAYARQNGWTVAQAEAAVLRYYRQHHVGR